MKQPPSENNNKRPRKKFKDFQIEEDDTNPDRGMKRARRKNERRQANQNLRGFVKGDVDEHDIPDYNDD